MDAGDDANSKARDDEIAALQARLHKVEEHVRQVGDSFGVFGFRWAADTCREMERMAGRGETHALQAPAAALRHHVHSVSIRLDATQ